MSKELIERARALDEAATPGPWHQDARFPETVESHHLGYICDAEYQGNGWDAAFIAASRELVPALCDALEAANNIIATLCAEFNCYPAELHTVIMREYQVGTDNANALEAAQAENARLREALAEVMRVHDAATSPDLHYHLCPQWRGVHGKCNCGADKAIETARAALEPRP